VSAVVLGGGLDFGAGFVGGFGRGSADCREGRRFTRVFESWRLRVGSGEPCRL
jgi:hypothetical protein